MLQFQAFMLKNLARSVAPTPIWNRLIKAKAAYLRHRGRKSWSAYGEDLIVVSLIKQVRFDIENIRYLDIGASDPHFLSNSYLLYSLGARGILIEPNPDDAAALRRKRPRDTVIEAALSSCGTGTAKLYRFTNNVYNSLDPARVERVVNVSRGFAAHERQSFRGAIDIHTLSINDVLSREFSPQTLNFLSIDIEGSDLAILQSVDVDLLRSRLGHPFVVSVERMCDPEPLITALGGDFNVACYTPDNYILVRS